MDEQDRAIATTAEVDDAGTRREESDDAVKWREAVAEVQEACGAGEEEESEQTGDQ
eukprot:CAMPEP_0202841868 /NCGR_PEP_ID=MMETSP1389-20130828/59810_1 /ASSEMBLY_ACC=CAM_ASM_000865 /TAXON_ID=302021 /ORGANISM="Rhodomonas sp., Strain CCMP768" /LENGTH=55 /DNA_ID=CAMNT_0049518739 /DNA_START=123 /DNA_END=287 /DNA_ORIENTATION=-